MMEALFDIEGRVTKEPATYLQGLQGSREFVTLTVSVMQGAGGKAKWHPFACEVWGKAARAELSHMELKSGDIVRVCGKLANYPWQTKSGRMADSIKFYVRNISRVARPQQVDIPQQTPQQAAFEQQQQAACGRMGQRSGEVGQLQDEDIPF